MKAEKEQQIKSVERKKERKLNKVTEKQTFYVPQK